MLSQWVVPVASALIGAIATVFAAHISANSTHKTISPFSALICPESKITLQQAEAKEAVLQSRLEFMTSENSKLKEMHSILSRQLEQAQQDKAEKRLQHQAIQNSASQLPSAQSVQSGEFRVSTGRPQALLNSEILLETERIYQGINPRVNQVSFALDYKSPNIPDRSGLHVSATNPVNFMHRGRRYRIMAGQIIPEDNSATLILMPID